MGLVDGAEVGSSVGFVDGVEVGFAVGFVDGVEVGFAVGFVDGVEVIDDPDADETDEDAADGENEGDKGFAE